MDILLLEVRLLLEKASKSKNKPKKYHQDFIDLESWRGIINHLLNVLKIEDTITSDNEFPELIAGKIFNYLDLLPVLDGISQEQLLELTDFLSEVFDLLMINKDAKKIITDLKSILSLIDKFEKEIPPVPQQVSIKNPELPKEDSKDTEGDEDLVGDEEVPDEEVPDEEG